MTVAVVLTWLVAVCAVTACVVGLGILCAAIEHRHRERHL